MIKKTKALNFTPAKKKNHTAEMILYNILRRCVKSLLICLMSCKLNYLVNVLVLYSLTLPESLAIRK